MKNAGLYALLVGFLIIGLFYFSNEILDQVKLFIVTKLSPFDLVYDPSVDRSKISGSDIINCIHGGKCPDGVTYYEYVYSSPTATTNSDSQVIDTVPFQNESPETTAQPETNQTMTATGQQQVSQDTDTKQTVPFADLPESMELPKTINRLDLVSYVVFGLIITGLISILVYFYKRR